MSLYTNSSDPTTAVLQLATYEECLLATGGNSSADHPLDSSQQLLLNETINFLVCSQNGSSGSVFPSVLQTRPFVPRLWIQVAWAMAFGSMVSVAVLGNLIVIWIILAHKTMRTVTNFFLLNLTCADLMTATLNAIFNFVFMLHSHWPFGEFYCILNNFIATLTVASSVFTIMATSIDRYVAVVHPLKRRMSRRRVVVIIAIIWLCASLLAWPNLIYSRAVDYSYGDGVRTICFLLWPDGASGHSNIDYIYNIVLLVLTYVLPFVAMAITYSLMGQVLWGSRGIGEETEAQRESIRTKQKVARMLIAVVAIFATCWLPYHAYFLYTYHFPEIVNTAYIQHIYLGIYWLAMSHSMYNPIIYCWMNKRFRNYFAQILFCCRPSPLPLDGSQRTSHQPTRHNQLHELGHNQHNESNLQNHPKITVRAECLASGHCVTNVPVPTTSNHHRQLDHDTTLMTTAI